MPLRIALVGTGRMGAAVEVAAEAAGHAVVARFGSANPIADLRDDADLHDADLAIDFSTPDAALDNLHRYAALGLDAVVGTTGWQDDVSKVRGWVEEGQNAVLHAPNFSLGVAVLRRALQAALPLLDHLSGFDAYVHELHHIGKQDSPSGTALLLADDVLSGLARKTHIEPEAQHGRIDAAALHVTSTRVGAVFGEHTVGFDSEAEHLAFRHVAKSRAVFAEGAVRAAEWLCAEERHGLFTLDDLLDALLQAQR
ncbi:MAG: 4-hydroxy-tetrahydrodipicolinate reductase [Bacteroidota bacterium]